jgi:hypothetical protein
LIWIKELAEAGRGREMPAFSPTPAGEDDDQQTGKRNNRAHLAFRPGAGRCVVFPACRLI